MPTQLDLRDLRYFETIAELEHVGRAAERLHLTQPALTRCVRRLEEAFGTALFERVGRGIRLTAAGATLLARARRLHLAADETTREMLDFARGESGQVKLGIVPTAAQYVLPPVCGALLRESPNVVLKLVVGQNDVIMPALTSGDLDMLISFGGTSHDGLQAYTIVDDFHVVAAGRSHKLLRKPRLGIRDLLEYRWILPPATVESRRLLDSVFDAQGLGRPIAQIETNLLLLMPPLIEQTGLLTFMSRRHLAVSGAAAALREIPVKAVTIRRVLSVIHRKDAYLSPAAQRLLGLLRKSGRAIMDIG